MRIVGLPVVRLALTCVMRVVVALASFVHSGGGGGHRGAPCAAKLGACRALTLELRSMHASAEHST